MGGPSFQMVPAFFSRIRRIKRAYNGSDILKNTGRFSRRPIFLIIQRNPAATAAYDNIAHFEVDNK